MEKSQVINTLTVKRHQIEAHIGKLERDLEQARADLSAVLAATMVFSGEGARVTAYMNLAKIFPRFELPDLCRAALKAHSEGVSTRAIAAYVIETKKLDGGDRHLRKAVAYKVIQVMRRWERERRVVRAGKVGTAVVWRIETKI